MITIKSLKTPFIHLVGWIIYLFLLTWLLSDFRTVEQAFVRSLYIIAIQCIVFYLNYFLLLPLFFERRRYFLYTISIAGTIIVVLVLFFFVDQYLFPREMRSMMERGFPKNLPKGFRPRMFHEGGPWQDRIWTGVWAQRAILFNGFHILFVLFVSTIARNLVVGRKRDREAFQLKNQVLEAESRMLKWQINPHFLFNTLNNIYSMSKLKSDHTPDAIHRLSNMLRYVIYDCNEPEVTLKLEITYMKSYIELQLLKDETIQNVTYDFNDADPSLKVAPLIFVTFLENSFKHSHIEDTSHSWINISLKTSGSQIIFTIENSIPDIPIPKDRTSGIGLENVRRRMELLYPGKYNLTILEEKNTYKVELIIEGDEN